MEDQNIAWHCGASSYKHLECRNANSIGIEMCVRKRGTQTLGATDRDWYFENKTVQSIIELVRYLMKGTFSDTDLLATASGAMICLALYGIYWLTSRRALRRQRILREQDYKGV